MIASVWDVAGELKTLEGNVTFLYKDVAELSEEAAALDLCDDAVLTTGAKVLKAEIASLAYSISLLPTELEPAIEKLEEITPQVEGCSDNLANLFRRAARLWSMYRKRHKDAQDIQQYRERTDG